MQTPSRKLFAPARLVRISDQSNMILVSGVVCHEPDFVNDAARQAEWIFARIIDVVSEYGGALKDIVQLRCYLVDLNDYTVYNSARARLWENIDNLPASATVGVATLLGVGTRLEVEAVAIVAT